MNKLKIGALVGLVLAGSSGCAHQIADMMNEQEERAEYRRMYGYPQEQRGPSDGDVAQVLGFGASVAGVSKDVPLLDVVGREMRREGRRMNRDERTGEVSKGYEVIEHKGRTYVIPYGASYGIKSNGEIIIF